MLTSKDIYQIVDNVSKEVTLFFIERKKTKLVQLDTKMQYLDSMTVESPDIESNQILGDNGNSKNPKLYFYSSDTKKISSQTCDFVTKKPVVQTYSVDLKKEIIIKSYFQNGNLYVFSVSKGSSIIKIYTIDSSDKITEKSIDLQKFTFQLLDLTSSNLYEVLRENLSSFERNFSLQSINTSNLNTLTDVAKRKKCYFKDNKFIMTFDTSNVYTQIITIDINSGECSEKLIIKPDIQDDESDDLVSNSFLLDNLIYQIKCSKTIMKIAIKDLNHKLVSSYTIIGDSPISFTNSPMTYLNGISNTTETLDKTSDFIKKTKRSNCGISCFNFNGNTIVTFGGVSEQYQPQNQEGLTAVTVMFGIVGALTYMALTHTATSNPDFINPYKNRLAVYTTCMFDNFGKPGTGKTPTLAINELRNYVSQIKVSQHRNVFNIDDLYFFGDFEARLNKFIIKKFHN
jgi:hypothetical protein